jgi:hypothetical protein
MTVVAGRAEGVAEVERRLLVTLAAWSTWSAGVGGVLWRLGGRERAPGLRAAGRTTVAWGAADAAVVAWGAWRARSRRQVDPSARAHRLARLTGVNAVIDVAYVAGGTVLATSARRRGAGLATVVQGVALLYLDTRYCLEFTTIGHSLEPDRAGRPLDSSGARDRRRPARGGGDGPEGNDSVVVRNVS